MAAPPARAMEGGVDGVELHAHEGFLQAQFLSPAWNDRDDEYGGSLENRMRLTVECLQAMREAVGRGVPLGVRLKAHDQEERGLTEHDYVEVVRRLEAMDLIDYVNLTGGDGGLHHGPMNRPCGEWLPFVRTIKATTGLPIMHAGRLTTPEAAEAALADGTVDVVCLTKAHVADPHFVRKTRENRVGDIRHCTRCLQECIGNMEHMSCVYNPVTSRERTWATLEPAEQAEARGRRRRGAGGHGGGGHAGGPRARGDRPGKGRSCRRAGVARGGKSDAEAVGQDRRVLRPPGRRGPGGRRAAERRRDRGRRAGFAARRRRRRHRQPARRA